MRIGHVVRQFYPSVGGLEEFVDKLSQEQAALGHEVRIITCDRTFQNSSTILPCSEMRGRVEIRRVPYLGSNRYPFAPRVLGQVRDVDVVHVHAIDFFFDFLAATQRLHRRSLVATTHGGFFHTAAFATLKKVWFRTLTNMSMRSYAAIAASSQSDFTRFRQLAGGGERLHLIENGVDVRKFASAASTQPRKRLVTLGRFSFNKQLDRLLDGVAALVREDPEWRLDICGMESDWTRDRLEREIDLRRLRQSAIVHVAPDDEQIRAIFSRASFFVSASGFEGFGISLVEAMSAGLIPIVQANDAFMELAKTHPTITTAHFPSPAGVAREIHQAWNKLLAEPDLPQRVKASVQHFAWPQVAERYLELYSSAAGGGASFPTRQSY